MKTKNKNNNKKIIAEKGCNIVKNVLRIFIIGLVVAFSVNNFSKAEDSDIYKISMYTKYYVMYWSNHFSLTKIHDKTTGKFILKKDIEDTMYKLYWHESQMKPESRSWEGTAGCFSYGLGRLMPQTAWELGWHFKSVKELYDVSKNIKYSVKYLCIQVKRYGSIKRGVSAYNAGHVEYTDNGSNYKNQGYVDAVYYGKRNVSVEEIVEQ